MDTSPECHVCSIIITAMTWNRSIFMLMWRCHHLLPGLLANGHKSRVSRLSDNNNSNDVKPEVCGQISLHLPYGWGKPRKTTAMKPSYEGYTISFCLKWGPFHPNVVGRITAYHEGRRKERRTQLYKPIIQHQSRARNSAPEVNSYPIHKN